MLAILWNVVALVVFAYSFAVHTPSRDGMVMVLWVGSVPLVSLIALIWAKGAGRSWLGLYLERKKAEESAKIAALAK